MFSSQVPGDDPWASRAILGGKTAPHVEGRRSSVMPGKSKRAKRPSINLTAEASEKLREVIGGHPKPVAGLRLQIVGRSQGKFQHVLSLVEDAALKICLPDRDTKYLDGMSISYEYRGENVSGLDYDNPNPLWFDEREMEIQDLFDTEINPAIAAHGGWVSLLGVEGTTAYVELGGGCQGCGLADVTLKHGIQAAILETVDGIESVVDNTDHAAGA